jgi:hypothetical protein
MIFWIASYPKSGNTWLRTLISAYYYSKDGFYNQSLLKNIRQFPEKSHYVSFEYNPNEITDTTRLWIKAQEKINEDKKMRFFKTHNIFGSVNNYKFTNKQNSIACIYIVRDPRNVVTSLKNHYELDDEKALRWMTNNKHFIYDVGKVKESGYGDFQFISSWEMNYKSWKNQKEIPVKIIRYEDLLKETYAVFTDVIEFINKTINIKKINKDKIKKSVSSTFFHKLKNDEKNNGFEEAVPSKNKGETIPFFYLGPDNDWRKILDNNQKLKFNDIFKKQLKELGYEEN